MSSRKRNHRRHQNNLLVLRLLILVVLVLVIFEGKLIRTMFIQNDSSDTSSSLSVSTTDSQTATTETETEIQVTAVIPDTMISSGTDCSLVGIPSGTTSYASDSQTNTETESQQSSVESSEALNSDKVVPKQSVNTDDSYFSDAVFIGDSRMEGFRNASGITQGDFMTSVGMTLTSISDTQIATVDGNITVYQGLSGKQYRKIYLMLGTNDLGFWPMSEFLTTAENVLKQFHELQPHAVIYICSVIYVEEALVSTDYVNNENVMTVNENLLQACDDLSYCYYINLNEIFSDGYHELISGISQDGVHLYENYLKQMLDYFKSHYLPEDTLNSIIGTFSSESETSDSASSGSNDSGTSDGSSAGNNDSGTADGSSDGNDDSGTSDDSSAGNNDSGTADDASDS